MAEEAAAVAERCLAMNRADPHLRAVKAFAHWIWGLVLMDMAELVQAHVVSMDGLHLLTERSDDVPTDELVSDTVWQLRLVLGRNYDEMNDYQAAREYVTQALAICRKHGKVCGQLSCLANLGWFGLLVGEYINHNLMAMRLYVVGLCLSKGCQLPSKKNGAQKAIWP